MVSFIVVYLDKDKRERWPRSVQSPNLNHSTRYESEDAPDLLAPRAVNFTASSDDEYAGAAMEVEEVKMVEEVLLDAIDALMFELGHMVGGTPVGKGLGLNFCAAFGEGSKIRECLARIEEMEDELRGAFDSMDAAAKFKSRARRSACVPKSRMGGVKTGGGGRLALAKMTKMADAFERKHFVDPGDFLVLQRIVKSGTFRRAGAGAKKLGGEGGVQTIVNPEQMRRFLKNPDKLIWGPVGTWGKGGQQLIRTQRLSIKGVDFIEASSRAASGGARRLTSGTGTVELAVAKLLDEATGEVRVVPVHLRGVADKKIKAAAFEK